MVENRKDKNSRIDCSNELASLSYSFFDKYRRSGLFCDVILEVDGCVFHAHRIVLAATIPFFEIMFSTDMKESQSEVIKISEVDVETMELILNFIYTGQILCSLENIEKVLRAADYFQISLITERCSDILKTPINSYNVLGIRQFAINHNLLKIIEITNLFIRKNFTSVITRDEFLDLEILSLIEILSSDELHIDSEKVIFEAAICWLKHDISRRVYAVRVLSTVRMKLLDQEFLNNEIFNNEIVKESVECQNLVKMAQSIQSIQSMFKNTARQCSDIPGIIYAVGGFSLSKSKKLNQKQQSLSKNKEGSYVEMYDPIVKRWVLIGQMLTARSAVGVAVVERRLYVIGGTDGIHRLSTCEMFDSRTSEWTLISNMQEKRSAMCVSVIADKIYVLGGYDESSALCTIEMFNVHSNKWITLSPMENKRCAGAAATLNELIYVMGGHNGVTIFNSMERFNPKLDQWEILPPMLTARCRHSAVAFQGKIYVAGGYNETFLNTFEVYDVRSNTWTQLKPMHLKRSRVSLVTTGSLIYAIGGYDGENNLRSIEIYDPIKESWEFGAQMAGHEGGVGACVIPASPKLNDSELLLIPSFKSLNHL